MSYIREVPEEEYVAIVDVFNAFDKNNNGSIGPNELRSVMQSLGQTLNQTETKVLMSMADTNQNGMINFDELNKVIGELKGIDIEDTTFSVESFNEYNSIISEKKDKNKN